MSAVIFAGGGTGGHLFPALAIAERLAECASPPRCVFVCSTRPLDAEILNKQGVRHVAVPAQPPGVRPRALWRFVRAWGPSVRDGRALIRDLRREHGAVQVVAMGGFIAAPIAQAGRVERVPITLVNLDAAPGRANRFVARHAAKIFTSGPVERMGWVPVPPIVRRESVSHDPAETCRARLGLEASRPTLLVTGASQGAKSINQFMVRFVEQQAAALAGWQVVHQTGKEGVEVVREAYARAGVPARVEAFFDDMGSVWGAADLAISRAGAGNVGEVWANRVPTIFMPYPFHKDQHQRLNAEPLAARGAAVVADDRASPEGNLASVGPRLEELVRDPGRRGAMRKALEALGPADGAERVTEGILSVCGQGG